MKVTSWLGKDENGKIKLPPASPKSSQECQNRMLRILEEQGELSGYTDFLPVDKHFMLCIWIRHDGLGDVLDKKTLERFCTWFREKATYPDYIRRGREALVQHGLVEVPSHVKRRMQGKARAMQGQFSGG
jgi:hypothetical protein